MSEFLFYLIPAIIVAVIAGFVFRHFFDVDRDDEAFEKFIPIGLGIVFGAGWFITVPCAVIGWLLYFVIYILPDLLKEDRY